MRISPIDSDYCIRCSKIEPGCFSTEYQVKFIAYRKGELVEESMLIHKDHVDIKRQWCRVDLGKVKNCLARVSMTGNGYPEYEFNVLLESIVKNSNN